MAKGTKKQIEPVVPQNVSTLLMQYQEVVPIAQKVLNTKEPTDAEIEQVVNVAICNYLSGWMSATEDVGELLEKQNIDALIDIVKNQYSL